jgi:hypothetical protein
MPYIALDLEGYGTQCFPKLVAGPPNPGTPLPQDGQSCHRLGTPVNGFKE